MGGPVAKFLIRRHQLAEEIPYNQRDDETPHGLKQMLRRSSIHVKPD